MTSIIPSQVWMMLLVGAPGMPGFAPLPDISDCDRFKERWQKERSNAGCAPTVTQEGVREVCTYRLSQHPERPGAGCAQGSTRGMSDRPREVRTEAEADTGGRGCSACSPRRCPWPPARVDGGERHPHRIGLSASCCDAERPISSRWGRMGRAETPAEEVGVAGAFARQAVTSLPALPRGCREALQGRCSWVSAVRGQAAGQGRWGRDPGQSRSRRLDVTRAAARLGPQLSGAPGLPVSLRPTWPRYEPLRSSGRRPHVHS